MTAVSQENVSTAISTIKSSSGPQAIEKVSISQAYMICPRSFEEALKFADYVAKSDLVPKDYRGKPANILVAMQLGNEIGLPPLQSVQSIAVINGRPGLFGDGFLAVIMSHPDYEYHDEKIEGTGDARCAVFTIKRKGHPLYTSRFSVADAKKAGLWDDRPKIMGYKDGAKQEIDNPSPWYCYPERMLQMRARGFGGRDKFADALRGMKSAEELADYPDNKTIEASDLPFTEAECTQDSPDVRAAALEQRLAIIAEDRMKELGYEPVLIKATLEKYKGRAQELIDKIRAAQEQQEDSKADIKSPAPTDTQKTAVAVTEQKFEADDSDLPDFMSDEPAPAKTSTTNSRPLSATEVGFKTARGKRDLF